MAYNIFDKKVKNKIVNKKLYSNRIYLFSRSPDKNHTPDSYALDLYTQ